MKNILSIIYLLSSLFNIYAINPYSATGHSQFTELRFVDTNNKLLKNRSQLFINENLDALPKRFWGDVTRYTYQYADATYVGNIIFSRSNKTSEPLVFEYSIQEVYYEERSYNIQGTISGKVSGKKKTVEGSGQIEVKGSYSEKESYQRTEKNTLKVTVYPNKKLTLRVAGKAKISSGFSKYYVCFITTKKGAWETVDVLTSYFELIEENA